MEHAAQPPRVRARLGRYVSPAAQIARHPWRFTREVFAEFRRHHGLLLAGAVAYYTLLSIVPLVILLVVALSHVLDPEALIASLVQVLDLVVPAHGEAIVEDLATFLRHRQALSWVMLATLLFFSSLAFGVLESAFGVIFHHRQRERARSWLSSALLPYAFIVVLGAGLIVITVVSGALQAQAASELRAFGELRTFGRLSIGLVYLIGVAGEILLLTAIYLVMPAGRLRVRHALIGGVVAGLLWEITRRLLVWYFATLSQINIVYGSFATTIALLLSFEIAATVLLIGAQVIAIYERRIERAGPAPG
ncbi:MAG: YihY/virulence factor BrkB family protein [Burkholderiales bacterium]|nr:YihY/virulence factor BrkB family protein [Burkholderiales bacterium]